MGIHVVLARLYVLFCFTRSLHFSTTKIEAIYSTITIGANCILIYFVITFLVWHATGSSSAVNKYPSSSHYTRNWDKLVNEIKKEEKEEKPEGNEAINKLLQQIYGDGSDEVKKAMNKSFVSSSVLFHFLLLQKLGNYGKLNLYLAH